MKIKIMKSRLGNLCVILVAAFGLSLGAFWTTHHAHAQALRVADLTTTPTAGVAKVTREDLFKAVTYNAEFRPYVEVALPAKVTGYVSKMNVDFGDKVKAGQLLADDRSAGIAGGTGQCPGRRTKSAGRLYEREPDLHSPDDG